MPALNALTRHRFLLGLAAATLLAFVVPGLGVRGGPLRPELSVKAGVAVIFLLQGLSIERAAMRAGALRWRLHAAVQLFIFAAFPAAVLLLDMAAGRLLPAELRTGFIFLAILPTTVSGCVVFTAAAGGNTTGALFNSAFANIAGVLITPLFAALLLQARGTAPPLAPMVLEVALLLLAPFLLGQLARPLLRGRGPGPRSTTAAVHAIIIFIVFTAFAGSVHAGAFVQTGTARTLAVTVAATFLFAAASAAAAALGRRLRFDYGDRVALLFCGSHKTLAAGAPLAHVIFGATPALGVILLPLVVYHAVQLLAGAAIVGRLQRTSGSAYRPVG